MRRIILVLLVLLLSLNKSKAQRAIEYYDRDFTPAYCRHSNIYDVATGSGLPPSYNQFCTKSKKIHRISTQLRFNPDRPASVFLFDDGFIRKSYNYKTGKKVTGDTILYIDSSVYNYDLSKLKIEVKTIMV